MLLAQLQSPFLSASGKPRKKWTDGREGLRDASASSFAHPSSPNCLSISTLTGNQDSRHRRFDSTVLCCMPSMQGRVLLLCQVAQERRQDRRGLTARSSATARHKNMFNRPDGVQCGKSQSYLFLLVVYPLKPQTFIKSVINP